MLKTVLAVFYHHEFCGGMSFLLILQHLLNLYFVFEVWKKKDFGILNFNEVWFCLILTIEFNYMILWGLKFQFGKNYYP